MQGDKKQGAGGKGTWGKIGDELVKDVLQAESDEEDTETIPKAFALEVAQTLLAEKIATDELEPLSLHKDEKVKYSFGLKKSEPKLKKPELIEFAKKQEQISVECRANIEFAYHSSTHLP